MSFPPGIYIITSAIHGNFACLPSNNHDQHVVGITDPESKNHQWRLKSSPQGRYSIENVEFGGFLCVGPNPQEEEEIIAISGKRRTWWTITMNSRDIYWICPAGTNDLSWGLPDLHDGTPLKLQSANSDARCLWKILPLQSEIFTQPGAYMLPNFRPKISTKPGPDIVLRSQFKAPAEAGFYVAPSAQGRDLRANVNVAYDGEQYLDVKGLFEEPGAGHRRIRESQPQGTWSASNRSGEPSSGVFGSLLSNLRRKMLSRRAVTGEIQSGLYKIINDRYLNVAVSSDDCCGSPISGISDGRSSNQKWEIIRRGDGEYYIKNHRYTGVYAGTDSVIPRLGDNIVNNSGGGIDWEITETKGGSRKYRISDQSRGDDLCWALPYDDRGTPITLQRLSNNVNQFWTLSLLKPLQTPPEAYFSSQNSFES